MGFRGWGGVEAGRWERVGNGEDEDGMDLASDLNWGGGGVGSWFYRALRGERGAQRPRQDVFSSCPP